MEKKDEKLLETEDQEAVVEDADDADEEQVDEQ